MMIGIGIIFGTSNNEATVAYASSKKNENAVNMNAEPISSFTSVKYILNKDYFLLNPQHYDNTGKNLNWAGVCTTVALQMLMSYHNYYSDGRIIPTTGNNRTFLDSDYRSIAGHPAFSRTMPTAGQGSPEIGTTDGFFLELYDLTFASWFPGLGQAIGLVKDAGIRFMNNHTPTAVRNDFSLTSGFFSASTARSDIDAGRPIVLGFQPIGTGADSFHVVPAYGYAKLDGVDGFIVHWGWGDHQNNTPHMWVPASWFGFQIRMSVNRHTHSFSTWDGGDHAEVRCTTCGVVDHAFTTSELSGNNLSITGVKSGVLINGVLNIPTNLYGRTVTQIGDNAFVDQYQMTSVILPNGVTSIGDDAFMRCGEILSVVLPNTLKHIGIAAFFHLDKLQSIALPNGLETIGDWAFFACSSLTNIVIPNSVQNIGYGAFYYCISLESMTLPFVGNSRSGSLSYKFSYIFALLPTSPSVAVPPSLKTVTITNQTTIASEAFLNCSNIENIILASGTTAIGDNAFQGCSSLNGITILSTVTSIGSGAFVNTNIWNNTQDNSIVYVGNWAVGTKGNLSGDISVNQNTLSIANSTFANQTSLTSVAFHESILRIGEAAFQGATSLVAVRFFKSTPPVAGANAFINNALDRAILVPLGSENAYKTASGFTSHSSSISTIQISIIYMNEGAQHSSANVPYNGTFANMPNLSKTGYTFMGWHLSQDANSNQKIENGNICLFKETTTLYARWSANTYVITFDSHGGTSVTSKQVTYNQQIGTLTTPTKTNYNFDGWFDANGLNYTSQTVWQFAENRTLIAKWTGDEFTLTFNANGGNALNPTSKTVTLGATIGSLPNPTRTGYQFTSWNTAQNGTGTTVTQNTVYTTVGGSTIHAQWSASSYVLNYNANGGNALNPAFKAATYDSAVGTLPTPIRTGHTFVGWNTLAGGGGTAYTANTIYKTDGNTTIYAIWSVNTYTITYNLSGGTSNDSRNPQSYVYGTTPQIHSPTFKYNIFTHWTVSTGGTIPKGGGFMPAGVVGTITLTAVWEQNVTTHTIGSGTFNVSSKVHITTFSASNVTVNIGSNVEEITFRSSGIATFLLGDISINVLARTSPLTIRIVNLWLIGKVSTSNIIGNGKHHIINAVDCPNLTIDIEGSAVLDGGQVNFNLPESAFLLLVMMGLARQASLDFPSAINARNLSITSEYTASATLTVWGGEGIGGGVASKTASAREFAAFGGNGIIAKGNLSVFIKNLNVRGGGGAHGVNGANGANQTDTPPQPSAGNTGLQGFHAGTNGVGTNGAYGGWGGIGIGVTGNLTIALGTNFTSEGGRGGSGGKGGNGGHGGKGGKGANGMFLGATAKDGGRGGDGANGGNGGWGGAGGVNIVQGSIIISASIISGLNGTAGAGGSAGAAGIGGDGGNKIGGGSANKGANGSAGSAGQAGSVFSY